MTLDVVMVDGDDSGFPAQASRSPVSEMAASSSVHVPKGIMTSAAQSSAVLSGPIVTPYGPGSSPTKYVSPRLRGSSPQTSPTTLRNTSFGAADAVPCWRSNLLFGETANTVATSSPDLPSHHSPREESSGTLGLVGGSSLLPDDISAVPNVLTSEGLVGPSELRSSLQDLQAPHDSDPPGTPAFRRLFRTACNSSNTKGLFEGARIKHGRFSAASLFTSLQDHSDRGVILSFSQRAPSYDHFRIWINSHMSQAGIVIDDASQLRNDFFLLLLHDQANQLLALNQKLFFLNKFVDIFPWSPAFAPHELSNKTRPIWVELTNLHPS
ncbi:unnamed protein product [Calypogeia fissa]